MTETKTYNGWTNYETWNVALWIDNDQGSYSYWQDVTKETLDDAAADANFTKLDRAKINLAERLKEEITEAAPDLGSTCYADLLGAALSEVNWYEIASNWLNDAE